MQDDDDEDDDDDDDDEIGMLAGLEADSDESSEEESEDEPKQAQPKVIAALPSCAGPEHLHHCLWTLPRHQPISHGGWNTAPSPDTLLGHCGFLALGFMYKQAPQNMLVCCKSVWEVLCCLVMILKLTAVVVLGCAWQTVSPTHGHSSAKQEGQNYCSSSS